VPGTGRVPRGRVWCQALAVSRAGSSLRGVGDRLEPEVLGDHHALDLVRALADLEDLLVAVEP
jgi:hypothetical protein